MNRLKSNFALVLAFSVAGLAEASKKDKAFVDDHECVLSTGVSVSDG